MLAFKEYLLEVKKKKGTVVGQQYGPPDNLISVDDIIRKVGNQKRSNTQNVSKLISINKDLENDEGILHKLLKEPSKDFKNRTDRANMSFPILVTKNGDIVDGSHRLAKAHFSNQKKIQTITVPNSILRNNKNLKEDLTEGSKGLQRLTRKNNSSVDIPDSQKDLDAAIEKRKPRESAFREKTKGMPVVREPKKEPRLVLVGGVLQQWRNYRKLKGKGRTNWWANSPTPKGTSPNPPTTTIKADRKSKNLKEDLRDWFSKSDPDGDWKRINSKGEVAGPCAREEGEPKPKCMSKKKRASLTKKERAAAVRAKRRHDPDADRSGSPINVSNYGKGKISEEILQEKNIPTSPEKWSQAKALARSKFKVYPSAYANGWAAKKYKAMGGGWETE